MQQEMNQYAAKSKLKDFPDNWLSYIRLEGTTIRKEVISMSWVYWVKLHDSKFQAGTLAKRMEQDWWIYGYECPQTVEVFRSKKGRFGVRYIF
jgi:hypothetical protein